MLIPIKAAYLRQLTFSVIVFFLFISCGDSNSIGGGYVNESEIKIDTVFLTNLPFQSVDPYTGQLAYSPIGSFNDPLFGEISSFALFKPSIVEGNEDEVFTNSASTILQLRFDTTFVYGQENEPLDFNIYRVDELWRGPAYKMSDEVTFTTSSPVASFSSNEIDSTGYIDIDLEGTWKEDFISFYTDSTDSRDSSYKYLDFGLAITANEDANQIKYLRFASSSLFISEPQVTQDTIALPMLDWAYDLQRTGGAVSEGQFVMSNTYESFLYFNLEPIVQNLSSQNFVRAELSLRSDSLSLARSLDINEVRTENPPLRYQLGPSVDLAYDLGFNDISSQAIYDSGIYRFDITDVFNANIFGNTPLEDVYVYVSQNFGLLGFNTFYDASQDPENAPKILIYSVVDEVE